MIKKYRDKQILIRAKSEKIEKLRYLVKCSGKTFTDYINELIDDHLADNEATFDAMWDK